MHTFVTKCAVGKQYLIVFYNVDVAKITLCALEVMGLQVKLCYARRRKTHPAAKIISTRSCALTVDGDPSKQPAKSD